MSFIAIVGPEATGKTTLAATLAQLLNVPLTPDERGSLLQQGGEHTLWEAARQRPVFRDWVALAIQTESKVEGGVVDGGLLDAWASFMRFGWNSLGQEEVQTLAEQVRPLVARYTHVVQMPAAQVTRGGGQRFVNPFHAGVMESMIPAAMAFLGIKTSVIAVQPGTPESRLKSVLKQGRFQT